MSWEHSVEQAKVIAPFVVEIYRTFFNEALHQGFPEPAALRIAIECVKTFFTSGEDDLLPPGRR